jgi:HEAT repeat protein
MGRIGVPAVPALAAALRSADADLRLGAADTLRGVRDGAKEAIPALRILASKDPDLRVRQAAKLALHDVGPTLQELAAFLERVPAADTKVRILKGIEAALGPLGARGAEMVPPLRRALQDESPSVRGEALSALVMIGEPAMVALDDIVARLHGDSNSWIRSKAALDLAHLHRAATTPDARARIVTELEAAQQDPEKEVRQAVAQTLRGARAGWQKRRERCEAAR